MLHRTYFLFIIISLEEDYFNCQFVVVSWVIEYIEVFIFLLTFILHAAALLAMQSTVLATAIPSVCLSVRLSVTRWYPIQTEELPNILGFPFNISATAEANNFKFGLHPEEKWAWLWDRKPPNYLWFSFNIFATLSEVLVITHRVRYFQLQLSHFLVDFYNFCTIENRNEYFTTMWNLLT